jgi:recombination protein RecR
MAQAIDKLVHELSRLPGVGSRSARRLALYLLRQQESRIPPLIAALDLARREVRECAICGMLDDADPCHLCTDDRRDPSILCVVEDVADVWAMERSHAYRGRYHVLGGTLSAIDGRGPDTLSITPLLARVASGTVKEVILALGATVAGQTTAHYVAERLATASSNFPPSPFAEATADRPSPPACGGSEEGITHAGASALIPPASGGSEEKGAGAASEILSPPLAPQLLSPPLAGGTKGGNDNVSANGGDVRGGIKITRLAQGIPVGGELDYLDDGTLTAALQARRVY